MVAGGARAAMVFLIQRSDVDRLAVARDIDPAYGQAFDLARLAGVEMLAYACRVTCDEIVVERPVPVIG
jgi:sugar fermentation stimulation protein A